MRIGIPRLEGEKMVSQLGLYTIDLTPCFSNLLCMSEDWLHKYLVSNLFVTT